VVGRAAGVAGLAGAHVVLRVLVCARLQQRLYALQMAEVCRNVQRSPIVLSERGAEGRQQGDSADERRRQRQQAAAIKGAGNFATVGRIISEYSCSSERKGRGETN
jgi:hypothetical protein